MAPAMVEAQKILEETEILLKEMKMLSRDDKKLQRTSENVTQRSFLFSALSIGVLLVSNAISYYVLKNYFKHRKNK